MIVRHHDRYGATAWHGGMGGGVRHRLAGRVARGGWRVPLIGVVLVVGVACGGGGSAASLPPPRPPAVQHRQLTVGGLSRTYRLDTPPTLDLSRPAPLVIVLGGVGNSGDSMVEATMFDHAASDAGFLVAYADGINNTWNAGFCCLLGATSGPDDVAFLSRVIDDVEAHNKVDPARVYGVGVSAGAMMAYRLGCDLSGRIAGVGSVAGAMIVDQCHPSRPVSVIELHGTADPEVPYAGGRTTGGATQDAPSTLAVLQGWASLDSCPTAPTVQMSPPVTTTTWNGCAAGTSVKLVAVEGATHTWFANGLGSLSGAVDATSLITAFFGLHPTP